MPFKVRLATIPLLALMFFVSGALAGYPPYRYGGSGQWKEGNGGVYTTQLWLNGTIRMQGSSGSGGAVTYGRADSWGYFGIDYVTATQTRTIHAYSSVAYDGIVSMYACLWWFGWARASAWVHQILRIYDTATWSLVTKTEVWVYSQTVNSGVPWIPATATRIFNGNTDVYSMSADFPATSGKRYAIEVFVEAQCATDGAGLATSQSAYNFWGPSQGHPELKGFAYVKWINWNYA
jgi:hypothetical protein